MKAMKKAQYTMPTLEVLKLGSNAILASSGSEEFTIEGTEHVGSEFGSRNGSQIFPRIESGLEMDEE